jgi:hypothetical protein
LSAENQPYSLVATESLTKLGAAAKQIAEAKTLDEAFVLRALFKEAQIRARQKGLIEVEERAVEYKFFVEDKIAELLEQMKETGERAEPGNKERSNPKVTTSAIKTLKDLGISKNESSRLQKFHNLPKEEKEQILEKAKKRVRKAAAAVINEVISETHPKVSTAQLPAGRFNVIYADPPWPYDYMKRGSPNKHYPVMSVEKISALEVPSAQIHVRK